MRSDSRAHIPPSVAGWRPEQGKETTVSTFTSKGRRTLFAAGALLGVAAGFGLHETLRPVEAAPLPAVSSTGSAASSTLATAEPSSPDQTALLVSNALADLAERVTPAVVRIEVRGEATATGSVQSQIPPEFKRFFQFPDAVPGKPMPRMGSGSGFLISPDGYIVTNNHVVADADHISVQLSDQRSFDAEVVGTDPTTDVALVKIDATDLPFVPWGSSQQLRVGELVMAIGSPGIGGGSLDQTVTSGIVSAKGRPLPIIEESLQNDPDYAGPRAGYAIENFIQTDAVINPGNSGGPMINVRGQVVGVNSAIASTDGHYQGYGFAIPSDLVRKVASDLRQYGHAKRSWLGVSVSAVTAEDADVYGLPAAHGVLVQSVIDDSPARKAGMRVEDVIVDVDGRALHRPGDLQQIVAQHTIGETVSLGVYRDGKRLSVPVRLGELTETNRDRVAEAPPAEETMGRLGILVADLTPQMAAANGMEPGGVVVVDTKPWMQAARRGVRKGMKILELNRKPVRSAADFTRRIGKLKAGSALSLKLLDPQGQERIVSLRVGE